MDLRIRELEDAAQILLGPPNVINIEQRRNAEQKYLEFRKSRMPYNICRYALNASKNEYLLFESASLIKDALIREWSMLNISEISEIKEFLMHYLYSQTNIPVYVRDRIIQCVAIMIKRGNIGTSLAERTKVFEDICNLLNENDTLQAIACSMIKAILLEYSITIKSSDVGLPWETHFKAKVEFESKNLINIFTTIMEKLFVLINDASLFAGNKIKYFERLLCLSETILSWPFSVSIKLHPILEGDPNPLLRPDISWKSVFLNPKLLELFFKLYWRVRDNPRLCHPGGNCLIQLSSLSGPIMSCDESRHNYVFSFLRSLIELLSNIEVKPHEIVQLTGVMKNLSTNRHSLIISNSEMMEAWMNHMTQLTCSCCMKCLPSNNVSDEEAAVYKEALDQLFDAWLSFLLETGNQKTVYRNFYIQVFDTFLKTHLSPPIGTRDNDDDEHEIEENEEDDRSKYRDQLSTLGLLGRLVPDYSLNLLANLLCQQIDEYESLLSGLSQNLVPQLKAITKLSENLHWLIIVTGSVLTLDNEGETVLIPEELMQYSIKENSNINQDINLKLLTSVTQGTFKVDFTDCDSLVKLITCVLRFCHLENFALKTNMSQILSPEVATTLVWFLKHFISIYICPNEAYYSEMSMGISYCFAADSPGLIWCLDFILDKVLVNLQFWQSEPQVLENTIALLFSYSMMMNDKSRGKSIGLHKSLPEMIELYWRGGLKNLPPSALSLLFKSFVLGITSQGSESDWSPQAYSLLFQPFELKYKLACSNVEQIHYLSQLLDIITGIVQGVSPSNYKALYSHIYIILQDCPRLLSQLHNYNLIVDGIIVLFTQTATSVLYYLMANECSQFYELTLSVIKCYAQYNSHKLTAERCAEDDTRADLELIVNLLTSLLCKDYLDLSPLGKDYHNEYGISGLSVCLFGLELIMPIMTLDLLRVPSFCLDYFKLITLVCESNPEKICSLKSDLLGNLLTSLRLGLGEFSSDISSLTLDCLQVLACYVFTAKLQGTAIYISLGPFLKLIMDLLLSHNFNSGLINEASAAFFTFICCYQEEFNHLVNDLLTEHKDQNQSSRLVSAFTSLTKGVVFTPERCNRIAFKRNFDKFFIEIRGILLIM